MIADLFICDGIDDGSRILGVGVNYDAGVGYDAATGGVYISSKPASAVELYRLSADFASAANVEFAGGIQLPCGGLTTNGSVLFTAGSDFATATYHFSVAAWDKSSLSYTDGRRGNNSVGGSTSATCFRTACANGGTGAFAAGDRSLDQMVVASVSSAGVLTWVRRFIEVAGYLSAASIYGVALDSNTGNAVVGGTITRTSDSDVRGIVAAFNSSGTFQWGFELHGTGSNRVADLCCDASGNTYVALGGSGGAVPLIAKLDSSGAVTATLNLDTAQVTDLLGICLQGTAILAVGKHASGGLAVVLTTTSLATPTGARLYDTAGAMSYPRNARIGYYGGFYFFNFAANGGNLCIAKLSADVLSAPTATFGNRFQVVPFAPSSAAYTLSSTATGANYTTSSATGSTEADDITGSSAISAPSLTDYFAS